MHIISSLEMEAFVDYCEMPMQLNLQCLFGPHAAGGLVSGNHLIHLEVKRLAFVKMEKIPWIAHGLTPE